MRTDRSADDLSDVVRRRLEALLAEIPPRRMADSADDAPAAPAARCSAAASVREERDGGEKHKAGM